MFFPEVIRKKRDGLPLSKDEIDGFISEYAQGKIPDYQASALLMAIFLNGMSADETVYLTEAMLQSGSVVDLSDVEGVKVDKHSTGGVGDKTSLIIAPICAALNVPVPMISGRGLGHTGGTLDKLESIPGFQVDLGLDKYREIVKKARLCLIGQTKDIAPADKKLYALRDVTATVENKSLISASIMSKKLAEGIDALVLDVKTGSGAFMKNETDSVELATIMMSIGKKMGKKMVALITDMNQPLGSHVGNALEVEESVAILKGDHHATRSDLVELSRQLAAYMVVLGEKATTVSEALEMVDTVIRDGSAFEKLKEITQIQNGDPTALDNIGKLPSAELSYDILATEDGYIKSMDALEIGKGAVILGAGRSTLDAKIDPAVGVVIKKKIGMPVKVNDVIMSVLYNDKTALDNSLPRFKSAIQISPTPVEPPRLIKRVLE